MPYVLGFLDSPSASDKTISDMKQAYWTNFAKTGNPNAANLPKWPRISGKRPATLVIDDDTRAQIGFREQQLRWFYNKWANDVGVAADRIL